MAEKYHLTYVKVSQMVKDFIRKDDEASGVPNDKKKKKKYSMQVKDLQ